MYTGIEMNLLYFDISQVLIDETREKNIQTNKKQALLHVHVYCGDIHSTPKPYELVLMEDKNLNKLLYHTLYFCFLIQHENIRTHYLDHTVSYYKYQFLIINSRNSVFSLSLL